MKGNKEHLVALEKDGKYLFHGSMHKLSFLEPRQPYTFDKEKDEMVEDGKPSVACTQFAELAIFRALANRNRVDGYSRNTFSFQEGKLHLLATSSLIAAAIDLKLKGYVYVFLKEGSEIYRSFEYRFYQLMNPVEVIEVSGEDMPEGVVLLED